MDKLLENFKAEQSGKLTRKLGGEVKVDYNEEHKNFVLQASSIILSSVKSRPASREVNAEWRDAIKFAPFEPQDLLDIAESFFKKGNRTAKSEFTKKIRNYFSLETVQGPQQPVVERTAQPIIVPRADDGIIYLPDAVAAEAREGVKLLLARKAAATAGKTNVPGENKAAEEYRAWADAVTRIARLARGIEVDFISEAPDLREALANEEASRQQRLAEIEQKLEEARNKEHDLAAEIGTLKDEASKSLKQNLGWIRRSTKSLNGEKGRLNAESRAAFEARGDIVRVGRDADLSATKTDDRPAMPVLRVGLPKGMKADENAARLLENVIRVLSDIVVKRAQQIDRYETALKQYRLSDQEFSRNYAGLKKAYDAEVRSAEKIKNEKLKKTELSRIASRNPDNKRPQPPKKKTIDVAGLGAKLRQLAPEPEREEEAFRSPPQEPARSTKQRKQQENFRRAMEENLRRGLGYPVESATIFRHMRGNNDEAIGRLSQAYGIKIYSYAVDKTGGNSQGKDYLFCIPKDGASEIPLKAYGVLAKMEAAVRIGSHALTVDDVNKLINDAEDASVPMTAMAQAAGREIAGGDKAQYIFLTRKLFPDQAERLVGDTSQSNLSFLSSKLSKVPFYIIDNRLAVSQADVDSRIHDGGGDELLSLLVLVGGKLQGVVCKGGALSQSIIGHVVSEAHKVRAAIGDGVSFTRGGKQIDSYSETLDLLADEKNGVSHLFQPQVIRQRCLEDDNFGPTETIFASQQGKKSFNLLCGGDMVHLNRISEKTGVVFTTVAADEMPGLKMAARKVSQIEEARQIVVDTMRAIAENEYGTTREAGIALSAVGLKEKGIVMPTKLSGAVAGNGRHRAEAFRLANRYTPIGKNQERFVRLMSDPQYPIVMAPGPSGVGKTMFATQVGIEGLLAGRYEQILYVTPYETVGEGMGFLPGSVGEKTHPWNEKFFKYCIEFLGKEQFNKLRQDKIIDTPPLQFMRGATLKGCFVILDEAQNATLDQFKTFMTRLGEESKTIIAGDMEQSDLEGSRRQRTYKLPNTVQLKQVEDECRVHLFIEDIGWVDVGAADDLGTFDKTGDTMWYRPRSGFPHGLILHTTPDHVGVVVFSELDIRRSPQVAAAVALENEAKMDSPTSTPPTGIGSFDPRLVLNELAKRRSESSRPRLVASSPAQKGHVLE
ncbi:MAG: PhoH family protein [Alphaproteobacteria bacterium]|nr:PhoH family protein [Alphaproteobacteria bacterium]